MAVVSKELLWRLKGVEHAYNKRLLATWGSLEGNPRGVGHHRSAAGALCGLDLNGGRERSAQELQGLLDDWL